METAPSTAEQTPKCSRCGAPLPGGPFGETCPSCLLGTGLSGNADLIPSAAIEKSEVPEAPNFTPTGGEDVSSSQLPHRFGDYELLEELGRGGMGVVYRARQISLDRVVAVKMVLGGSLAGPDFAERFRAEATAAAKLDHPNIVAIHEIGQHAGRQYFSMDYVPGGSLLDLVREQPLMSTQAALYAKTIAAAASHAHELGILHRDLKPSNVLIDAHRQPRITDFGLAKRLVGTRSTASHTSSGGEIGDAVERVPTESLTVTGQALGSPHYSAPEQAAGRHGDVGPRSDIYSIGAILYFLLTGRPPLIAETLDQLLWQVINTEPVSPRLLNPNVPADLETICLKCLEKDPSRRYPTARALAEELSRFLEGKPIQARPVGLAGKTWRWCRRKPALAIAAAGIVVLLAVVTVITTVAGLRLAEKERALRHSAYAADMRLAQQALEADNFGLADHLLGKYRLGRGQHQLRGWEWRYFWAQSRPDSLFRIGPHSNAVLAVAFSPDGTRLASSDIEGAVKLSDLVSRREIATRLHRDRVDALAFSPDGRLLASAGGDNEIRLWDGATLTEAAKLEIHEHRQGHRIVALHFSENGKSLTAVSLAPGMKWMGAKVTSWDLESQQQQDEQEIRAWWKAALSPDGAMLATGGANGEIWLWDLAKKAEVASWTAHSNSVSSLAFSPDGHWLVSGGLDKVAKVWEVPAGREQTVLGGFRGTVSTAIFSPDARILATASYDQTIRLWDTVSWKEVATLRGQMSSVWSMAFSPKGDRLASGGAGGAVKVWNPLSRPTRKTFFRLLSEGKVERVGAAGAIVLKSSSEVSFMDLSTGRERKRLDVAGVHASTFAASPRAQWIAAGNQQGEVYLWNVSSNASPTRTRVDTTAISDLEFSPDEKHVAAAVAHARIKLLEIATGETVAMFNRENLPCVDLEFSPDGRLLAVGYDDGVAVLWDLRRKEMVRSFKRHTLRVTGMAFSPDGRHLATASEDGTVRVWDIASGRRISTLEGRGRAPWSVSWSPDGRRLAAGTGDSTILIWDFASGQEVAALKGHTHSIVRAQFLPDGDNLVSHAMDELFLWHAPAFQGVDAGLQRSR